MADTKMSRYIVGEDVDKALCMTHLDLRLILECSTFIGKKDMLVGIVNNANR